MSAMSNQPANTETVTVSVPGQAAFRDGMARLAAAVHVITTDGPAGRFGFTATAVCSVSDTPPTLLVCVNANTSSLQGLLNNGVLCVNTLAPHLQEVASAFASGRPMDERFASGLFERTPNGVPRLAGALVSFDCRVMNVIEQGSHKVLFCAVEDIVSTEGEEDALVYFARRYHTVAGSD
ncbi:flavin reductase [Rhizobium halophytocola]|uniref:Flavin reductase n=1 Tax=Rhizobium halophytocola TaxID=735519 RepID=A0ABS4DV89_9HYPH|nr:flavin reductase [Rhizobium halophytocola]MBP1849614.1 flavin reductase [Rhizobium halophytocola]